MVKLQFLELTTLWVAFQGQSFALFFFISQAHSHFKSGLGIHLEVPDILLPDVGELPNFPNVTEQTSKRLILSRLLIMISILAMRQGTF